MAADIPHPVIYRLRGVALEASEAILAHYATSTDADSKADGSPITAADRAAHELIVAALPTVLVGVPVISEEDFDPGADLPHSDFWLVDPLDGTKEFISRNGEFTVNIALVRKGRPVLGVVHVPVSGETYAGDAGYSGAAARQAWRWRGPDAAAVPIAVRAVPAAGLTVLASRSHNDETALMQYLGKRLVANIINAGSSLKFCVVARGDADLYPRFGPTMEWDTAAGHAVLLAAGGRVQTTSGTALIYGKSGLRNGHFIASGA
jgi:3'(2'), 5'-bisphosphate nucleotidase